MTNLHRCECPQCGKAFTLAELKEMAVGDGWQRYLHVRMSGGQIRVVSFDEYVPGAMTPLTEGDFPLKLKIPDEGLNLRP